LEVEKARSMLLVTPGKRERALIAIDQVF